MWRRGRMEKIIWTNRVGNEEWDKRGEEYPTCNKNKKTVLVGHFLCRNCLLKHVIERMM
jgi:hypothetical protein